MKLWFDEDLSPTLVQVAGSFRLQATCNRDRGMLGVTDHQLRRVVQDEDYVLVTDNASDFRPMFAREDVHPGLIVVPAAFGRSRQQELTRRVIEWILDHAAAHDEPPALFMVNKLVEVDATGACTMTELPPG